MLAELRRYDGSLVWCLTVLQQAARTPKLPNHVHAAVHGSAQSPCLISMQTLTMHDAANALYCVSFVK